MTSIGSWTGKGSVARLRTGIRLCAVLKSEMVMFWCWEDQHGFGFRSLKEP